MAEQPSFRDFQTMAAYIATHPRLQEIVEELEADLKADKTLFNEANKAPKSTLTIGDLTYPMSGQYKSRMTVLSR